MSKKILIVEDNPQNMRLIEMALSAESYFLLEEGIGIAESIIRIFPKKQFCQIPFSVSAWDSHQDILKEKNHGRINFLVSS